ncbi:MAG: ACT domain-containing protein, partial [Meiothermus silvanus]|nr:ACT domain-containing protein [Allomeiothermus silvanus]
MSPGQTLRLLEGSYAVSQLEPSSPIPSWAEGEGFVSISRTKEELSVVCREDRVPPAVKTERGWR